MRIKSKFNFALVCALIFTVSVTTFLLTSCGEKEEQVYFSTIETKTSGESTPKPDETETPETKAETEAQTEATEIEAPETEAETGVMPEKPDLPYMYPYYSTSYRKQDYVYNEESNSWDFEFRFSDVRLVWEKNSSGKIYIEYGDVREEVPWAAAVNEHTYARWKDLNGDGVKEFILHYNSLEFVYDIAKGEDLSPAYAVPLDSSYGYRIYIYPKYAFEIANYINEGFAANEKYSDIKISVDGHASLSFTSSYNMGIKEDSDDYIICYYSYHREPKYFFTVRYVFGENGCYLEAPDMKFF